MQIYTSQDLKNLNSSQKQSVLDAEKTFITFGEGAALTAFKLSDIVIAVKGMVEKSRSPVKEAVKKVAKRVSRSKKK